MKHLFPSAALPLATMVAIVALSFLPAPLQAQTLTLQNADTVEAEFRVGGTGKFAVMFQFANGKTQSLLGAVKADTLKRTVEENGKKMPKMLPMADAGDWGNQSTIDFDGWCFVTFPLTKESPARHIEPGAGIGQWQGNAEGILDYPLKLVGLYVQTHRQSLDLTQMKAVRGNIRLKEVSVIGDRK